MNTFTTKLHPAFWWKEVLITDAITFIVLTLLNLLSLSQPEGATMFVIFEISILLVVLLTTIGLFPKAKTVFRFEGNRLYIDGLTARQHYVVYDIPATDFILTQSTAEKAKNCGTMKIKNTIFRYSGVMNFAEMTAYIKQNF